MIKNPNYCSKVLKSNCADLPVEAITLPGTVLANYHNLGEVLLRSKKKSLDTYSRIWTLFHPNFSRVCHTPPYAVITLPTGSYPRLAALISKPLTMVSYVSTMSTVPGQGLALGETDSIY